MPKPIEFDGMLFGPDEIEDNRSVIIELRDIALEQGKMEWAVALSHTVMLLAKLKEVVEAGNG